MPDDRFGKRPFPPDEASREAIRMEQIDYLMLEGYRKAMRWNRSLRCERGDHGCRNDGTGCICSCHDRRTLLLEESDSSWQ